MATPREERAKELEETLKGSSEHHFPHTMTVIKAAIITPEAELAVQTISRSIPCPTCVQDMPLDQKTGKAFCTVCNEQITPS